MFCGSLHGDGRNSFHIAVSLCWRSSGVLCHRWIPYKIFLCSVWLSFLTIRQISDVLIFMWHHFGIGPSVIENMLVTEILINHSVNSLFTANNKCIFVCDNIFQLAVWWSMLNVRTVCLPLIFIVSYLLPMHNTWFISGWHFTCHQAE